VDGKVQRLRIIYLKMARYKKITFQVRHARAGRESSVAIAYPYFYGYVKTSIFTGMDSPLNIRFLHSQIKSLHTTCPQSINENQVFSVNSLLQNVS
jgi:hypothetical protein